MGAESPPAILQKQCSQKTHLNLDTLRKSRFYLSEIKSKKRNFRGSAA